MKKFTTIDEYINDYPKNIQIILEKLRQTIKKAAPEADEAIEDFKKELSEYQSSKGSIRFLLDKPIPFDLVTKIVKARVKQNLSKNK